MVPVIKLSSLSLLWVEHPEYRFQNPVYYGWGLLVTLELSVGLSIQLSNVLSQFHQHQAIK